MNSHLLIAKIDLNSSKMRIRESVLYMNINQKCDRMNINAILNGIDSVG